MPQKKVGQIKKGDILSFTYHEKPRLGGVVESEEDFIKCQIDKDTFKTFLHDKMTETRYEDTTRALACGVDADMLADLMELEI